MMPGMPKRRSHDYVRHGTTSLFAAFNIADGTVISELHRRHRATEFKKFLVRIDKVDQPGGTLVRLPDRPDDPQRRAQERASPGGRHPRWIANWNENPRPFTPATRSRPA
jgi:hypothetical protein